MAVWIRLLTLCTAGLITGMAVRSANADLVKLKNGGELRGKVEKKTGDEKNGRVIIKTMTGAVITVERKSIQFITQRPLIVEEYESLEKSVEETIEAHWELAEWCRQNRLNERRKNHLKRIIEIDPNHKKAHYALKHTKHDGKWMTRDEYMKSRGYVKHKGKYITPQELELIEKSKDELEAEKVWYKKVRLWLAWLNGRKEQRRNQGLEELQNITDPNAVSALVQFMQDDKNKLIRGLLVKILSQTAGEKPVRPLVVTSLFDADAQIRIAAKQAINEDQYEKAIPFYVEELKNDLNAVVLRAGKALGQIGNKEIVPSLIEALVTTHRYKVQVRNGTSFTVGSNGSFVNRGGVLPASIELMLRSGQFPNGVIVKRQPIPGENLNRKTVIIKHAHNNKEVLAALLKLTGQNLGYDERTWRLWWAALKADASKVSASKKKK